MTNGGSGMVYSRFSPASEGPRAEGVSRWSTWIWSKLMPNPYGLMRTCISPGALQASRFDESRLASVIPAQDMYKIHRALVGISNYRRALKHNRDVNSAKRDRAIKRALEHRDLTEVSELILGEDGEEEKQETEKRERSYCGGSIMSYSERHGFGLSPLDPANRGKSAGRKRREAAVRPRVSTPQTTAVTPAPPVATEAGGVPVPGSGAGEAKQESPPADPEPVDAREAEDDEKGNDYHDRIETSVPASRIVRRPAGGGQADGVQDPDDLAMCLPEERYQSHARTRYVGLFDSSSSEPSTPSQGSDRDDDDAIWHDFAAGGEEGERAATTTSGKTRVIDAVERVMELRLRREDARRMSAGREASSSSSSSSAPEGRVASHRSKRRRLGGEDGPSSGSLAASPSSSPASDPGDAGETGLNVIPPASDLTGLSADIAAHGENMPVPGMKVGMTWWQDEGLRWNLARERMETGPDAAMMITETAQSKASISMESVVETARTLRGGINADEPGLGKTLILLAMAALDRAEREAGIPPPPGVTAPTLVIMDLSPMGVWERQAREHFTDDVFGPGKLIKVRGKPTLVEGKMRELHDAHHANSMPKTREDSFGKLMEVDGMGSTLKRRDLAGASLVLISYGALRHAYKRNLLRRQRRSAARVARLGRLEQRRRESGGEEGEVEGEEEGEGEDGWRSRWAGYCDEDDEDDEDEEARLAAIEDPQERAAYEAHLASRDEAKLQRVISLMMSHTAQYNRAKRGEQRRVGDSRTQRKLWTDDVARNYGADVIFRVKWNRVVADEAHDLSSPKTLIHEAFRAIRSHSRWLVTGTPCRNSAASLLGMLHSLGVWHPSWTGLLNSLNPRNIAASSRVLPGSPAASAWAGVRDTLKLLVLRRRKDDVLETSAQPGSLQFLPGREVVDIPIPGFETEWERRCYAFLASRGETEGLGTWSCLLDRDDPRQKKASHHIGCAMTALAWLMCVCPAAIHRAPCLPRMRKHVRHWPEPVRELLHYEPLAVAEAEAESAENEARAKAEADLAKLPAGSTLTMDVLMNRARRHVDNRRKRIRMLAPGGSHFLEGACPEDQRPIYPPGRERFLGTKTKMVLRMIEDLVGRERRKVVVFSQFKAVVDELYEVLSSAPSVSEDATEAERQENLRRTRSIIQVREGYDEQEDFLDDDAPLHARPPVMPGGSAPGGSSSPSASATVDPKGAGAGAGAGESGEGHEPLPHSDQGGIGYRMNFRVERISGSTNCSGRADAERRFMRPVPSTWFCEQTRPRRMNSSSYPSFNGESMIMLCTLAGGESLHFVESARIILMEPCRNDAVERQTVDRCHRIGQKDECVIAYRFCVMNTVDQAVLERSVIKTKTTSERLELPETFLNKQTMNWTEYCERRDREAAEAAELEARMRESEASVGEYGTVDLNQDYWMY